MAHANKGQPLELIHYNSSTGKFEVGKESLAVLQALKGPVSVVAVCGRARQVSTTPLLTCMPHPACADSLRAWLLTDQSRPGQELHPQPAAADHGWLPDRLHDTAMHQGLVDVVHSAAAGGRRRQGVPHREQGRGTTPRMR